MVSITAMQTLWLFPGNLSNKMLFMGLHRKRWVSCLNWLKVGRPQTCRILLSGLIKFPQRALLQSVSCILLQHYCVTQGKTYQWNSLQRKKPKESRILQDIFCSVFMQVSIAAFHDDKKSEKWELAVPNCLPTKRTCGINAKHRKWSDVMTQAESFLKAKKEKDSARVETSPQ